MELKTIDLPIEQIQDFCDRWQITEFAEIPWREIAGMRDVIVHEYDQVDLQALLV